MTPQRRDAGVKAVGFLAIGPGRHALLQALRRAFVDDAGVVERRDYFMRGEDVGHLVLAMVLCPDFELSGHFELSDRFPGPPSPDLVAFCFLS